MEGAFDVITIGTATQDIFYPLLSDDFKFEKGAKAEVGAPQCFVGGGAVNAAVTFARQELKTAALFRIGSDSAGESIVCAVEKEGIVAWSAKDMREATGQSAILLYPSGERTALAHRGAADSMPLKDIPFAKLKAKWVYIAPSNIDAGVIEQIINHCYAQGILVAFNPSAAYCADTGRLLQPLLSKIKVLLTNREEAGKITGIDSRKEKEIFSHLDELVDGICVMTDGPQGAHVSDGNHIYTAGIFANKNLVSRTGAGDAFGSGFVVGLIRKEDITYAIRLASANATAVTEHLGAHKGALTRSQFEKDVRWKTLEIKHG
ncbi:MAG: carbohydrate kinase family protein [Candidatus Pacebacteria bacterium]|nr:carbohydrate kinase family protein [Candidatus Paceibacterota bacterium]